MIHILLMIIVLHVTRVLEACWYQPTKNRQYVYTIASTAEHASCNAAVLSLRIQLKRPRTTSTGVASQGSHHISISSGPMSSEAAGLCWPDILDIMAWP